MEVQWSRTPWWDDDKEKEACFTRTGYAGATAAILSTVNEPAVGFGYVCELAELSGSCVIANS